MIELIGWVGAFFLSICGAPQAYKSHKEGHSDGMSWGLLFLWGIGEVFLAIYVAFNWNWPLMINYLSNIVVVSIMLYYKVNPRT